MKREVALRGLDEAEEKLDECGFACACFADEGDVLAALDGEVNVLQGGGCFVWIREGEIG